MSLFDAAFPIVVGIEAGYVNDPQDPGGETKYGVSKRAYPNEDIPKPDRRYGRESSTDGTIGTGPGATPIHGASRWSPSIAPSIKVSASPTALKGDTATRLAQRAVRYTRSVNFPRFGSGWMTRLFNVCVQSQKVPT
jgi:hypothetical protein